MKGSKKMLVIIVIALTGIVMAGVVEFPSVSSIVVLSAFSKEIKSASSNTS